MRYQTGLIRQARREDDEVRYPDGNTRDIIETVLYGDKKAAWYTELFAPTLKGRTLIDTCKNIWQFVKTQIPYKVDETGIQDIKSPGRLWADKVGDCKSFSLFTASCLKNLGIPYGYRFTSYDADDPTPTHVYVYVPLRNGEIILDSVWSGPFNTQKQFTYKQDRLMSKISYLGSVGGSVGNAQDNKRRAAAMQARKPKHVPGVLVFNKDLKDVSEEEFDLLLTRQRLEIDKANSAAVGGPFNWQIEKYDKALGTVNNALHALNTGNVAYLQHLENHFNANGQPMIGGFFGSIWKGIKKAGKGIAKGAKFVGKMAIKVATFPLRMLAKLILEIYLPKAAGGFLYLFAAENALPDKMRAKRKKSEKFKNFVCKKIGMKEKHFMGIIRNSLTKKLGMSPENYLAKTIKSSAVKGIGDVGYHMRRKVINQQWIKKGKMKKFRYRNAYLHGLESHPDSFRENRIIAGLPGEYGISGDGVVKFTDNFMQQARDSGFGEGNNSVENAVKTGLSVGQDVASGNYVGAIIKAIQWIINKLGGKKEGVDIQPQDLPDPVADAGNAYNYGDLKAGGYETYTPNQRDYLKYVTSQAIDNGYDQEQAAMYIKQKAPFVNNAQAQELGAEAEEGYEPLTEQQGIEYGQQIKRDGADMNNMENNGGGTGVGFCKC